jgi:hypothetical protein
VAKVTVVVLARLILSLAPATRLLARKTARGRLLPVKSAGNPASSVDKHIEFSKKSGHTGLFRTIKRI